VGRVACTAFAQLAVAETLLLRGDNPRFIEILNEFWMTGEICANSNSTHLRRADPAPVDQNCHVSAKSRSSEPCRHGGTGRPAVQIACRSRRSAFASSCTGVDAQSGRPSHLHGDHGFAAWRFAGRDLADVDFLDRAKVPFRTERPGVEKLRIGIACRGDSLLAEVGSGEGIRTESLAERGGFEPPIELLTL
jgi:hypothetical protein